MNGNIMDDYYKIRVCMAVQDADQCESCDPCCPLFLRDDDNLDMDKLQWFAHRYDDWNKLRDVWDGSSEETDD